MAARSALLLMDFQNHMVGMVADAPALLARAGKARAAARAAGMAVMHVRVAFTEADYAAIPPRNKSFSLVAANRMLPDGSEAAAIHSALAPAPGEEVFRKVRVGALSTTSLDARLKALDIAHLVLAGISTSGVVLSTVRDAADRDYRLTVIADCCADPDAEVHRLLTEKILSRQAEVETLDDFLQAVA